MTKPTKTQQDLVAAECRVQHELTTLRDTVREAYPKGSVLRVRKGRADIQVEITGYPGGNPAVIGGFNIKTGNAGKWHWRDVQEVLGKRGPQGSIVPYED